VTDSLISFDFDEPQQAPPSGRAERFGGRWRLIGAGLSNVWRYGDLELPAASGRLLMRGANGTGKTTALEALWPYLLDLDAAKLAAGKSRRTSLTLLMSEGATSKRRYGYAWLTFAPPAAQSSKTDSAVSFGVRLQYSAGGSPAVKVVSFTVPGRPIRALPLHGAHQSALELEEFTSRVAEAGGQVFGEDGGAYVEHLAARVWQIDAEELKLLAGRLREVRNPTLLGDVSPQAASEALRASLPGVSRDVIHATAEALAESRTTREAFARDHHAEQILRDFADVWTGHVVEVARLAHTQALEAATVVGQRASEVTQTSRAAARAVTAAEAAVRRLQSLRDEERQVAAAVRAIEVSGAYQAAGRLADLDATFTAEHNSAEGAIRLLRQSAEAASASTRQGRQALSDRLEDLDAVVTAATEAGAEHGSIDTLLSWTDRPRSVYLVADTSIDPGSGLTLHYEPTAIRALALSWRQLAERSGHRADAAQLAVTDHRSVTLADEAARRSIEITERAEQVRDDQQQRARRAEIVATTSARSVVDGLRSWAQAHPDLRGVASSGVPEPQQPTGDEVPDGTWEQDDLDTLADAESAFVLATVDGWAETAVRIAERSAATDEQDARQLLARAADARAEATELRARAGRLRSGELLSLPRPSWAGPGDDTTALGAALEWTADATSATDKAVLEAALAASGVLGAQLTPTGAGTDHWSIDATGAPLADNLAAVLTVDTQHPLAYRAQAVLTRIRLADTSDTTEAADSAALTGDPAALIIGRDGTFRAGVLFGRPAAALQDAGGIPPAAHIGSRQRRAAALVEADRLDSQARDNDAASSRLESDARSLQTRARATRVRAASFPARDELRRAESARATAQQRVAELDQAAELARGRSDAAQRTYEDERRGWTDRTTSRDLPADLEQLQLIRDQGRAAAKALIGYAAELDGSIVVRLERSVGELPDESRLATELSELAGRARRAVGQATDTEALLIELRSTAGDTDGAVARHRSLTHAAGEVTAKLEPAEENQAETAHARSRLEAKLESAQEELRNAQPRQISTSHHLRALFAHPAVSEVFELSPELADPDELLEQTEQLLDGRRTYNRRTLGERYDRARAELAGTWILARGDAGQELPELDVFVLTHSEREYSPAAAAVRAVELAHSAEAALAVAEQTALTDFVIGRLPSAIGIAWTRMHDWKSEVNAKMRTAESSSGVGVQVQVDLSQDLPPSIRTVHELSCRVGDADRTETQKAEVGGAIQALLAAADGDTMVEKLTVAVDIREWVDVHYVVTRPDRDGGRTSGRWNSRTGLSGGERRLVVLAPMLAAIAAAYDRLGPTGLRLVPLDEVPVEVDERGREGLARYIAELDLDLVCTSYLWDGAPGAWDGIDAHDLEAAPDGTVVAFPMLIRGLEPLPGEADETS